MIIIHHHLWDLVCNMVTYNETHLIVITIFSLLQISTDMALASSS